MAEQTTYKIMIVDDHALFRSGMRLLLTSGEKYKVIAEASNGLEMMELLKSNTPDVVLLDISMPEMDGIQAAELALKLYPNLKIITLSMYTEDDYYFKMVGMGIKGILLKNSEISEVFAAIDAVIDGGSYFSQELLINLVAQLRPSIDPLHSTEELSNREREILVHICQGQTNSEIAESLYISKRTVDKHRANILEKTACKNTANLVVYSIKNKLVEM